MRDTQENAGSAETHAVSVLILELEDQRRFIYKRKPPPMPRLHAQGRLCPAPVCNSETAAPLQLARRRPRCRPVWCPT